MAPDLSLRDVRTECSSGQHHGPCEDSRREPWPSIGEREGMRSLLREGLRFLDPTLQSRSEGNGQQGTGRQGLQQRPHISTQGKPSKGQGGMTEAGMKGDPRNRQG